MSKPFASSADTSQKTDTLEVLGDGIYALTAEGDPNMGAIEAEDFVRLSSHRVLFTWGLERVWLHEYRPSTWKPTPPTS